MFEVLEVMYFLESFLWEWIPIVHYTDIPRMYGIECMMSLNLFDKADQFAFCFNIAQQYAN